MSKRENKVQINENETVRQAQALQARLAALPTDAPPLTRAQQRALYERALQKAGLAENSAQTAASAANQVTAEAAAETAAAAAEKTSEAAVPAKSRPQRSRLIRWQRWALGTAAALLVVFGGARLLSGGFFSMKLAAPETAYQSNASVVTEAEPGDAPAELYGALEDAHSYDTASGAAEEPAAHQPAAEIVEETAEETEEELFVEVELTDESAVQEKNTAGGGTAQTPDTDRQRDEADSAVIDGSMAEAEQESAVPDMTQLPVVMVQGRLYYSMGSVLAAEPAEGDLLGSIGSTVPSGTLPQQELQANFPCTGAPCARYGSGIALLLEDGWVYFAPVG
ncbi:MAG: hypothetical protein IJ412_05625 [Oscillospiraceae bacterium]|nr:hypothetical protein [Oscillospiraceae bacterium]